MAKEKDYKEIIAKNLVYYRKANGMTQFELAEKLNYSDKNVSKWERGESYPDIITLKAIADLYGINVNDFFREKQNRYRLRRFRRRFITVLLSIAAVWLVATAIYVPLMIFSNGRYEYSWLTFVWASVPTCLIAYIYAIIYKQRFAVLISASALIWVSLACIYLTTYFFAYNEYLYLIFIVGAPLEVIAILQYFMKWSFATLTNSFKKFFHFKDKKEKESESEDTPTI